ncbi:MAG: twin-arginine translocase subunit TatB [Clostridia bacterium]|nr:twin-arginine translocase subunit TatB [Clostridia bacterium]
MFNIGFAELLLVLVIAYVIVGPKDLPKVARWLGRMVKRMRRLIQEVKEEIGWNEMMSETEDIRKDIDQTLKEADVTQDIREATKELNKNIGEAKRETFKDPTSK